MKKIVSILLIGIMTLSLAGCSKPTTTAKAEETAVNAVPQTQSPVPVQTALAQPTGDSLKDELLWPIGKFGYHEPPEEIRQDAMGYKGHYQIYFHSERYGDLTLDYDTKSGQRTLFTKGQEDPTGRLMIISEDNPISIEQALQDLKMGDSIARNFGK